MDWILYWLGWMGYVAQWLVLVCDPVFCDPRRPHQATLSLSFF